MVGPTRLGLKRDFRGLRDGQAVVCRQSCCRCVAHVAWVARTVRAAVAVVVMRQGIKVGVEQPLARVEGEVRGGRGSALLHFCRVAFALVAIEKAELWIIWH